MVKITKLDKDKYIDKLETRLSAVLEQQRILKEELKEQQTLIYSLKQYVGDNNFRDIEEMIKLGKGSKRKGME